MFHVPRSRAVRVVAPQVHVLVVAMLALVAVWACQLSALFARVQMPCGGSFATPTARGSQLPGG